MLAWTKPGPRPAVMPANLPLRMSARISLGWRGSIGIRASLDTLLQVAELGPEIGVAEHLGLFPAEHTQHLGRHLQGSAAGCLLGHPRDVRAHDDILELEEAAVGGHRLLLEDVDARRADLPALETGQEGVLVLDLAAGGIDED